MTSSLPSSCSEDGGDSYGRISLSDVTGESFTRTTVLDTDDQFLAEVVEPSPKRSLPLIDEKLYSNDFASPLLDRRRRSGNGVVKDGDSGDVHAVKTGETSTSDKEGVVERRKPKGRKRPQLILGDKPKRRRYISNL